MERGGRGARGGRHPLLRPTFKTGPAENATICCKYGKSRLEAASGAWAVVGTPGVKGLHGWTTRAFRRAQPYVGYEHVVQGTYNPTRHRRWAAVETTTAALWHPTADEVAALGEAGRR